MFELAFSLHFGGNPIFFIDFEIRKTLMNSCLCMNKMIMKKRLPSVKNLSLIGLTIQHVASKDLDADGNPTTRMWINKAMLAIQVNDQRKKLAKEKPWFWEVRLVAYLPDGHQQSVTFTPDKPLLLHELDPFLVPYRNELFAETPDRIDWGWQAVIKRSPMGGTKK